MESINVIEKENGMTYIKNYKFTLLSIILILIAVLMPGDDVPSVSIPNIDKFVHVGMFAFLTLCFYGEYFFSNRKMPSLCLSWGMLELFAITTELLQYLAEGRSCDIKDFLADTIGIVIVITIMRYLLRRKDKSNMTQ